MFRTPVRLRHLLAAMAVALCAAGSSFAGGTVNQFTLPNGIKVLHKRVPQNPLVTAQLFLRGGTVNETREHAGLANFTQLMLLQGTENRSAERIARDIEDIGGSISSDTEHDFTSLGVSVLDSHVERAMEILSDIVRHPSFPESEIEKERFNVLAAIQSRQDQIFNAANDLFNETFYGDHPYSWPDIGRAESVAGLKRSDLVAWHARHYVADNMLLVIVGNIDIEEVRRLADRYFAAVPKGQQPERFPEVRPPGNRDEVRATKKFQQAYIMIGYPVPALGGKDYPTLKVLNAILGGRMSGRLFVELREKLSLAYEVNSFYPTRTLGPSRFVVYMGLEKKNLDLAGKRILEILNDLKDSPVSEKELEETKNFIRGVYLLDHQTIGRQAWHLGWWEVLGAGYGYDEQYLEDLMAVRAGDIRKAARKYFGGDAFVRVRIVPEDAAPE